jgi:membrane protein DedA with SNARE-associated domain
MSGHEINHLLADYGCAVVFAAAALQALGAPLPGTTVLIAAALVAASRHSLPIEGVIAAGAAGALVGTSVGYLVGRWGGEPVIARIAHRLHASPDRVAQVRSELARRGAAWLFVARFITGLRNVAGLVAGATGMAAARFLAVSAAAALVWATVNGLEYYFFGRALAGASTWVQVSLVAVGLAWTVVTLRLLGRRAVRRITASAPSGQLGGAATPPDGRAQA